MGADLIGYLILGPSKIELTPEQRQEAQQRFNEAQEFCEAYQAWEEGAETDEEADRLSEEMNNAWKVVENRCSQYDEPDLYHGHFVSLEAELGESATLNGIIEWWNRGCNIGRDSVCRTAYPKFPDTQVAFAGDMSWGDSPDGFGYQMFELIDMLDLYGILGLW